MNTEPQKQTNIMPWVALALVAAFFFMYQSTRPDPPVQDNTDGTVQVEDEDGEMKPVEVHQNPGKLEFAKLLRSEKVFLVYFTATWCEPCEHAKPEWHDLLREYHDKASFCMIDVDEVPAVQRRERVTDLPTWIVYYKGREEDRQVGYPGDLNQVRNILEAVVH